MRGDGVADTIWLLQTIICQHQRTLQPLNFTFLHIKKAFDSVSHKNLLLAAGRMGVPPPMLGYLGELYGDAWTCLHIGPHRSDSIKVSRGLRQDNPLSVHLFNAAIDWALDSLHPELSVMVGEMRVNARAFADDIALITRTPGSLQCLLSNLAAEFRLSGLEVTASQPRCKLTLMARGRCGLSIHTPICRFLGNRYLQLTSQVSNDTWGFLSLQ